MMKNIPIKTVLLLLILSGFGCSKNNDDGPSNLAPEVFELIGVTNGAIQVGLFPTFSWNEAIDPENDEINYSLIIDSEMQPTTIAETNISDNSVTISNRLKLLTTYYWKIRATDSAGNTTESETYSFTTRNIGVSSNPLVENAAFTDRAYHSTAIFDGNFYVINGTEGPYFNDIWTSSNGADWILNNSNVAFSARCCQTSVVFNNKIWIIGGSTNSGNVNDVWSSSNGSNWSLENSDAAFSPRAFHESVVFNNKIWVIGGGLPRTNDVWSSSDGINWSLDSPTTPFSPRYQHSCIVFDNKIWIIGGFTGMGLSSNDVWSSSDGVTWVESTNNAPFYEGYAAECVVLDDKIWIIGAGSALGTTSLWYSNDGNNWILAIEDLPLPFRRGFSATVFNDKIYMIGGIGAPGFLNDVWVLE